MHLIDHDVGKRLTHGALVTLPPCGVGSSEVYDIALLTVYSYSLCEYSRSVAVSGIKDIGFPLKVALDDSGPQAVAGACHLHFLLAYFNVAFSIVGSKEAERRCLRCICHLIEMKVLSNA